MIESGQEVDDLLIGQHVLLQIVKLLGNLDVVHLKSSVLLVVILLLLKGFHKVVLLAEKHLLTSALNQHRVDLLGQGKNVVERCDWQACNLHLEALDSLVELNILLLDFLEVAELQLLDDRLHGEAKRYTRSSVRRECVLVIDDRTSEKTLNDGFFAANGDNDIDDTSLDDVDRVNLVTWAHPEVTSVHLLGVQAVDDRVENGVSVLQVVEERKLLECHLDEAHVLVVVLKDALLDVLKNLGMLLGDGLKVLLHELSNRAVLQSNN